MKESLRYEYDLNSESIVFDLGGYEGKFANTIFDKYKCKVFVFEPIKEFYDKIKERFKAKNEIRVFNYGVLDRDFETDISISKDSSSIFDSSPRKTENKKLIKIRNFETVFEELGIDKIDLMKVNIEGSEYELMKFLTNNENLIKKITNIQVQFHDWFKDAKVLREEIITKLKETHKVSWNFPFVWESWELKK